VRPAARRELQCGAKQPLCKAVWPSAHPRSGYAGIRSNNYGVVFSTIWSGATQRLAGWFSGIGFLQCVIFDLSDFSGTIRHRCYVRILPRFGSRRDNYPVGFYPTGQESAETNRDTEDK